MHIFVCVCIHTHTVLHDWLIVSHFFILPPKLDLKFIRKQTFFCALYIIFALPNRVHSINKHMMLNSFIMLQIFEFLLSAVF